MCEEQSLKVNTEARLVSSGPENCSMKGHKKGWFKAYAQEKEEEKTNFFFKSPVFHSNNIERIKFIYFLLISSGWCLNSYGVWVI